MTQVNLFTVFIGFVHYTIWMSAFNYILTPKFERRTLYLLEFAWYPCIYLIQVLIFPYLSVLRSMGGLLTLGIPVLFFYADKAAKRTAVLITIYATTILVELVNVFILPAEVLMEGLANQPLTTQIYAQIIYISVLSLAMFLESLLFKRYQTNLSLRELLLYALFPLSQLLLLARWMKLSIINVLDHSMVFLIVSFGVCVIADAAMFYLLRATAQRARLQAENSLLLRQVELQKEHYVGLIAQYESVRHMRHDINNHLHTIQILLDQGNTAEASAYAAELRDSMPASRLGQCQNPVLDAFLYDRQSSLHSRSITVEYKVSLPPQTAVSDLDLISAFGNLLDNAAEACQQLPNPVITVKASIQQGYLLIETDNPVSPEVSVPKPLRIPQLERGVGFHILDELAAKYDGGFTFRQENGRFLTYLTLKEN